MTTVDQPRLRGRGAASSAPSVAIVVLNYNGLALTQDCIRSLLAIDYPNARVIAIDNGSTQDESVPLRAEFGDRIDLIRHEEAYGFCRGNNVGMRLAVSRSFDYVLLLNNDTTVEPDFLDELVDLMESDRTLGAAGPKVLIDWDRSRIDSVGGVLDLWTAKHHNLREHFTEVRRNLAYVHGCAIILRREVIEKIGGLDEDYYAYWEESDYCLRLRRAGWTIAVNPRSVVYHKVGQTNLKLSNRYVYYMVRNGFLCMKKNGRWYQWPSFAACFMATSVAKYTAYLLVKRPRDVGVVYEALSDFAHGRLGRKEFARG